MKKWTALFVFLFASFTTVDAIEPSLRVQTGYFFPVDKTFREVYGGGLLTGAEFALKLNKHLGLWLALAPFSKQGKLTVTEDETKVHLTPLNLGVNYILPLKEKFDLHAGGGLLYTWFKEENLLGRVTHSRLGFILKAGVDWFISRHFLAVLNLDYTACRMQPLELSFQTGGLTISLGLGYCF